MNAKTDGKAKLVAQGTVIAITTLAKTEVLAKISETLLFVVAYPIGKVSRYSFSIDMDIFI